MTTARDLCLGALRDSGVIGVGQTATAEDINDAILKLNRMLAQWAARRWLVYTVADFVVAATGALSYGIGPGGAVNVSNRPPRVDAVFARLSPGSTYPLDYPLGEIQSRDDYNTIGYKAQPGVPTSYFYDNAFPVGNVFIWPVPNDQFELHLNIWQPPGGQLTVNSVLGMPLEYEEPLHYNMAVRLRAAYRLPADPALSALALAGMSTLRSVNATIPQLQMPTAVTPRRYYGGWYGGWAAAASPTPPPTPPPSAGPFILDQSNLDGAATL